MWQAQTFTNGRQQTQTNWLTTTTLMILCTSCMVLCGSVASSRQRKDHREGDQELDLYVWNYKTLLEKSFFDSSVRKRSWLYYQTGSSCRKMQYLRYLCMQNTILSCWPPTPICKNYLTLCSLKFKTKQALSMIHIWFHNKFVPYAVQTRK